MSNSISTTGLWGTIFHAIFVISGCTSMNPSASIRVEVDVYKGPLSKPISIQRAELMGIIQDASLATLEYFNLIAAFKHHQYKCTGDDSPKEDKRTLVCGLLSSLGEQSRTLRDSLERIRKESAKLQDKEEEDYPKSLLSAIAKVSARMKTASATAAASQIPLTSDQEAVRVAQAMFSTMTSEYGNLIGSRANALMIQKYGYDADGTAVNSKELHLSKYLADSSTTKAPRLYEWYDAKTPFYLEEWNYSIPGYNVSMTDRIRIYEQMFNDTYWSNVNTVYASGTGEVRMALIRDDIGNWNLKNFDNDPAELLTAYKDVTLAGINATTKLIETAASKGSIQTLRTALNMADQFTNPVDSTTASNIPITAWHQRAHMQILQIGKESQGEWKSAGCGSATEENITQETTEKIPMVEKGKDTSTEDQEKLETQKQAEERQGNFISKKPVTETSTDSRCTDILKGASNEIKRILRDHSVALETLQEVYITQETSNSTASTAATSVTKDTSVNDHHYGAIPGSP